MDSLVGVIRINELPRLNFFCCFFLGFFCCWRDDLLVVVAAIPANLSISWCHCRDSHGACRIRAQQKSRWKKQQQVVAGGVRFLSYPIPVAARTIRVYPIQLLDYEFISDSLSN